MEKYLGVSLPIFVVDLETLKNQKKNYFRFVMFLIGFLGDILRFLDFWKILKIPGYFWIGERCYKTIILDFGRLLPLLMTSLLRKSKFSIQSFRFRKILIWKYHPDFMKIKIGYVSWKYFCWYFVNFLHNFFTMSSIKMQNNLS